MSDDSLLRDSLLRKLGQLAREQDAEAPPAELLSARPEADRARIAASAIAALAPRIPAPRVQARPRRRYFFALLVPLAGAAALLLLIPRVQQPGLPLPAYGLEISGGVAEVRAAPAAGGTLVLEPGVRVELRLRPRQAIAGPVDARLYWRLGRDLRRWPVRAEPSADGVLRVIAPAEAPFGSGDGEIIAVVARPDALPEQADLATLEAGRRDWQVLRARVRWR